MARVTRVAPPCSLLLLGKMWILWTFGLQLTLTGWVIKADAGVTLVTVWRMMSRHKHRYLPPSPSQSRRIVLTISGIRNELFVSVMRWLILRQCYHFLLREQLVHHEIYVMWVCWLRVCVSVYPHRKYYLENTDVLLIFLLRTRYRRYHLVFPGRDRSRVCYD